MSREKDGASSRAKVGLLGMLWEVLKKGAQVDGSFQEMQPCEVWGMAIEEAGGPTRWLVLPSCGGNLQSVMADVE